MHMVELLLQDAECHSCIGAHQVCISYQPLQSYTLVLLQGIEVERRSSWEDVAFVLMA